MWIGDKGKIVEETKLMDQAVKSMAKMESSIKIFMDIDRVLSE